MMSLGEVARRLLYFVRRDRYTAELEEEVRLHLELRAERLQDGGLTPDVARYAAKRKFGNSTHIQERSRDMWGFLSLEQLGADLKFAVRRLRNRPGFSAATIAVAALGIGATTAVFSAVDAAILRPLPFLRPAELVMLPRVNIPFDPGAAYPRPQGKHIIDINDVAGMHELFSAAAGFAAGGLNIDDPTHARRVHVGVVTASFFSTLGITPRAGRTFIADEGRPGGPKSVIISDALWRAQFGAADVLGKSLVLSGTSYTIVGIMPSRFSFPSESDLWIPMTVPATFDSFAAFRGFLQSTVIARLARGVSPDDASRQLFAKWEQAAGPRDPTAETPIGQIVDALRKEGRAVVPWQYSMIAGDRRTALLILLGATALLLLIACANVANLLLSDAATRTREVALREVLGATRARIVRQLLAESLLLAFSGAVVGVALAPATLGIMRALMPQTLAGTASVQVDLRVLAFATALALFTGVVFGLWPALGTSRVDPGEAMKSGGHGATSGRLGHTRRLLITAELALTVMLLIGSGLMLKSFYRLMAQDFGLNPDHATTLEISFASNVRAPDRSHVIHAVIDQIAGDPTIQATGVGVVNDLPLSGSGGISISLEIDGTPAAKTMDDMRFARYLMASGGYFAAMGIPIVRGRTFNRSDDTVGQRAAIISQAMARKYWPGVDALNRTFHLPGSANGYTVVGITADLLERRLDDEPTPQMYFSVDEQIPLNFALVVRSQVDPATLLGRITAAVHRVDPAQAVYNVRTMDAVISTSVAPRRTNTVLIAIFAGLALVLSAFGVYAVVSYSVTQRAREFGIRSALGANRRDILGLVSREMAVVVAIGLAAGLGGAWALVRVMSSMLFKVPTHDVSTFVAVPLVLLVPAAIATLIPSIRASRISPTEVMRAE
jgi:predicted permease